MYDANLGYRAIYYTLANDATLMALVTAVVQGKYPKAETDPEDAYPFVNIVPTVPPTDVYYNGDSRAKTDRTVAVYGIQRYENNSILSGTLDTIAARIDTLLHAKTITILDTDETNVIGYAYIYRESPLEETITDGVDYCYLGGNYSISTQSI